MRSLGSNFYDKGKPYSEKAVLQQCLLNKWQKIELYLLKLLVGSMQNRCVEVLEKSRGIQSTKQTFTVVDLKLRYLFEHVIMIDLHRVLVVQTLE